MTSSSDRLNQIEVLLAATVQITRSNTMAIASNSAAIAANRADIAATNEAIASTQASVDGLVQIIVEFSARSEERLNRLDDAIADINKSIVGINTTNKNLQRILAQLIRHNRDSSDSEPQP